MQPWQPPPQFPEAVPPASAAAVFQALAKSPENRWPTAATFAEASSNAAANPEAPRADPALFAAAPSPAMPVATGPHPFTPPTAPSVWPRRSAMRKRLMIILPTAVAAIVAAVAALGLSPWLGFAGDGDGDGGGGERGTLEAQDSMDAGDGVPVGSGSTAPGESASEASNPTSTVTADDATAADEGEGAEATGGENDGGGGDEASDGATEDDGGMVEPSPANLPDVRGEWYTDARDNLVSQGWTNVSFATESKDPDNGQTECSVLYQNPEPGTPTDYDTAITLTYLEFAEGNC